MASVDPAVPLTLPDRVWSELIGMLLGLAWLEPQREQLGRLAGLVYAAYIRSKGMNPESVVQLSLLPEQLLQGVIDHG